MRVQIKKDYLTKIDQAIKQGLFPNRQAFIDAAVKQFLRSKPI